jgi:hypothetical protein
MSSKVIKALKKDTVGTICSSFEISVSCLVLLNYYTQWVNEDTR